jgi:uncharacterized membrane protein YidH (DUF202 family)
MGELRPGTPPRPAARHARVGVPGPATGPALAAADPPTGPTTLSLVLSRRARREALAAASAAGRGRDPRLLAVERTLLALEVTADVAAAGLCAVSWLWLFAHAPSGPGRVAQGSAVGLGAVTWLQPVVGATGGTLALLLLLGCLLMAPVVNPFYTAPADRRGLYLATTATFGVLAVTTVVMLTSVTG